MKRFAILIVAAIFAASAHAAASFYESRTPRHALAVEIVSLAGDDVVFGVTVTELPGGKVLASQRLTGKIGEIAGGDIDVGEQRQLRIRVSLQGKDLSGRLDIFQGDVLVDVIQSVWATQSLRIRIPAWQPSVLRVGGDVKAPVLISRVEPVYSEVARKAGISGIVICEVVIDRTGVPGAIRVLKPLPFGLDQAAVDAVKHWRFEPGTLNGKPVDVIFNVTVNFKLDTPPDPH